MPRTRSPQKPGPLMGVEMLRSVAVLLLAVAVASAPPESPESPESASAPVPAAPGREWEPQPQPSPTEPSAEPSTEHSTEPSTEPPEPGCPPCKPDRCPRSSAECAAGAGLAVDPCGCCGRGVCGLAEGVRCYDAATAADLSARALGVCGDNMDCVRRSDLSEMDQPEALCVCRERGAVCGSDNATYASSCQMLMRSVRAAADEAPGPPATLWLKHRGPCRAAPWVVTPPAPVSYVEGSPVSLECEVKGYPAPLPSWERINTEGIATPLPGDDASLVVMVRGGPEPFMATSWLQIMALRKEDVGTYICVATNSEGVARAASEITIIDEV